MIKYLFLSLILLASACSSKEEFDQGAYDKKVRDTESRFDKLFKDLDKETK